MGDTAEHSTGRVWPQLAEYLIHYGILLCALLIMLYLFRVAPDAVSISLATGAALLLLFTTAGGCVCTSIMRSMIRNPLVNYPLFPVVPAVLLTPLAGVLLLPDIPLRGWAYFVSGAVAIVAWFTFWLPVHFTVPALVSQIAHDLSRLWNRRELVGIWLRYQVLSRYSQTVLGILWIIMLPLSTTAVLAFVFGGILGSQTDVPYVSFLLAALIPYSLFNRGITGSTVAFANYRSLVQRIYFPREVVVLIAFGEGLVDVAFGFGAMIVVNLLFGVWPNGMYIYLPLLLVVLSAFTLGAMLFVSYFSVLIRDVPQLAGVLLQLNFYLLPIIYPIERLPSDLRVVVMLNPLSPLLQQFRCVILIAQPPDFVALAYPLVWSVVMLCSGYVFFKRHEYKLADTV
jgi:ABC-type polysaccharide/polyol phosphate export permease